MNSIGRTLKDVDSLLVTHEHSDHIKGVGVLARRYGMNIYANQGTWDAMSAKIGKVPLEQKHIFDMGKTLSIGDVDIESFGVSHDAAAPQFYRFYKENRSFVMLTDTGYCNDRMRWIIKNSYGYFMESNHDL